MSLFTQPSARQINLGLAVLRVITGIILAAHGGQKLFVFGFGGVTGAFAGMGIPFPGVTGPLVAVVEFFGGLALVAGLLTRLAALGLAINMLGAILFVHASQGFFAPAGIEFPLALVAALAGLTIMGGGALSADNTIGQRHPAAAR